MFNRAKGGYDELEGGEFVVNKHATAANLPLLEQLNKRRNHYGALGQIRSKRVFQEGGLNAPQLLSTVNNNISTILDESQLAKQADAIAAKLTEGMLRVIGQNNRELMGVVVDGLNKKTQRDAIELHAYKKSRI
jgi:hypothetical protein